MLGIICICFFTEAQVGLIAGLIYGEIVGGFPSNLPDVFLAEFPAELSLGFCVDLLVEFNY